MRKSTLPHVGTTLSWMVTQFAYETHEVMCAGFLPPLSKPHGVPKARGIHAPRHAKGVGHEAKRARGGRRGPLEGKEGRLALPGNFSRGRYVSLFGTWAVRCAPPPFFL